MQNHATKQKKITNTQSNDAGHGRECILSAFEVGISHGTSATLKQKQQQQKCCLMSSKEVFEMVYGPANCFCIRRRMKLFRDGTSLQCIKLHVMYATHNFFSLRSNKEIFGVTNKFQHRGGHNNAAAAHSSFN